MPVLSEYDLSGQVAILATSGGDEGPFLAQALAEAGASVFAIARHQAGLDAVLSALPAGSLSHSSGPYGAVVASNSAEAAVQAMAEFDRRHSKVDILVNDARSMFAAPAAEIAEIEWDEIQGRNAKLPFLLSQQVLPRMAAKEYGRIVNVVSELAERGMINGSAFAASQAALLSLTRSWRWNGVRGTSGSTHWERAGSMSGTSPSRCNGRSCWSVTRRCAARATPGISGRCWSTCVPSPATIPPASRYTWTEDSTPIRRCR